MAQNDPDRCNCLVWALAKVVLCGGRVGFRRSKGWAGKFHVVWVSPEGMVQSYVPWDKGFSASGIWFRGYVKRH